MSFADLCARANKLFTEEYRLMKLEDKTVPEGTVTYKHAVMRYVKKDGTVSRYEYTYPYSRINGVQKYVKRAARTLVEVLEGRKRLKEVRRQIREVMKEIAARVPASLCPDEAKLREQWQLEAERIEQNRKKKDAPEQEAKYITSRGDKVKSRGECVVGNALEGTGFLYEYEPYFYMKNGSYRRPDFQAYGIKGRFFIELLGMGDNAEYRKKNAVKLKEYKRAGIKVGKNLIIFENRNAGIDSKKIREVLQEAAGGNLPKRVVYI